MCTKNKHPLYKEATHEPLKPEFVEPLRLSLLLAAATSILPVSGLLELEVTSNLHSSRSASCRDKQGSHCEMGKQGSITN